MSQSELAQRALRDPEGFWAEQARAVHWFKEPSVVLRRIPLGAGIHWQEWFPDGETNLCFNALDRHVLQGNGNQLALYWDSPLAGNHVSSQTILKRKFTFSELLEEVQAFAAVLKQHGLKQGDRCLIYMPMIPEAMIAMLAVTRLGAIHSVVFGGFAGPELAKRIEDAKPKVIVSCPFGFEPKRTIHYSPMIKQAVEQSHFKPETLVIVSREGIPTIQNDEVDLKPLFNCVVDYHKQVQNAKRTKLFPECARVASSDPSYILYTSGTTGKPKGVLRDTGGYAVALQWSMKHIYGVNSGETFFAASDFGWVVGHSYICYGPLIHGCASIIYEGKPVGTPDPGAFWRIIQDYKVCSMFAAPTALRAIRKEDPSLFHLSKYDTCSLRSIYLAGERCDPSTFHWINEKFVSRDHWWQTETGWPMAAPMTSAGRDAAVGSSGPPVPGYDIQVVDEQGIRLPTLSLGEIVVKTPLPPGTLKSLYENEQGFISSYLDRFPGFYRTGDSGFLDKQGNVHIMSRVDDVINVAGHRLSTGSMEETIGHHPAVAECAVVGVSDSIKGEVPFGFAVLKDGIAWDKSELAAEIKLKVRQEIGAIACLKDLVIVPKLPKTRSGKILRSTLKKIIQDEPYPIPATIEDPHVLEELHKLLRASENGTRVH